MDENSSNINFDLPLSESGDCSSSSQLNEIKVEIIQEGAIPENSSIIQNNKAFRKRTKSSKITSNHSAGYKASSIELAPKVKIQVIDREPSKEILETWREELQKNRQVCCPFTECQLSYCSIRGLLLHYRACSGKRNDDEIVKCKICCNYVSGRISLAHHNRLLHSGMPTKALNSFMESQAESKKSFYDSMHTTKSRRQVRKPARYREPQDGKDEANKQDDFIQNLSPMTSNDRKSSKPCATVTRLPSGSYKKEDFPEAVLKSSFLYRMGLAPTDVASNVVVLEDEVEDKLPSPLPDDAFKLPSVMCNSIRSNYSQIYQRTKHAKVDTATELPVNPEAPPVKRKRGRPRKDKLKVEEPIINSESQKEDEKSPKRKRRRKNNTKANEKNEFVSIILCGECWEEFRDPVSFDKHVATKHGTGPLDNEKLLMKEQKAKLQKMMRQHGILTCPNQHCKKPLLSITGYLNHIKNCKQEDAVTNNACNSQTIEMAQNPLKAIVCRECKETFTKDVAFENHVLLAHHGLARVVGDDRPFTEDDRISAQKKMLKQFGSIPCPNCPKSYLSIQGLQYHLRTCKSDTRQDMVCNYCRLLFTNLQSFREHVIDKHNGLALPVGDERIYSQEEKQKILQQVLRLNQKLVCLNKGCSDEFKTLENYLQHEEFCPKAKPVCKIECGVCSQKFNTQTQFNSHALIAHNGLARVNGGSQIFTEEEKVQILKKTLHNLKRLHCLRENCGKTFISLAGYQYHVSICGQESVSIECKVCGKKLKEASMRTHMKTSHPPTPPPQPKEIIENCSQVRTAAKRAREKVSEIARNLFREEHKNAVSKSESSESDGSTYELPDVCKMYSKPSQTIPSQTYSEWKKQFDCNGRAKCTNTGCSSEFSMLKDLKRHFLSCKFSTLSLCYVCNICQKRCRRETQMQSHVDKMHSSGDIDGMYSDDDDSATSHGQSGYGKFNFSSLRIGQDFEPLYQAAEWTYDYYKRNYENSLFSLWLPDIINWKKLSESEYQQYLPEETTSISFQAVDVIKKEKPTSNWTKLDRFKCKSHSDAAQINPCTLFAGGPVWAMAWCPTPANKVCDQYLALSSRQVMQDKVPVSSGIKPALIQIWKVGDAFDSSSSLESKFALGIACDFGDIWKLEWCPSGCWNDENNNNTTLPRLGLLAATCSNGRIYIFSVPNPASLPKTSDLPIFEAKPTVILQTEPVLGKNSNKVGIDSLCVTMSWQRHKGHSRIAGGFANGYVALWNISVDSPFLRKPLLSESTTNTEICFNPYKIFRAHADSVKDIVWAPFSSDNYLATVGLDRQVHVWSIDDTSLPINSQKLGIMLSLAWSPYWCGVFVTQDECYNVWRTNLKFVDTGYFGNGSRCLASHNGCIWNVSINDWLNCSATCDSNGEVIGTVLTQLLYGVQNLKNISRKRFPIYRATVSNLKIEEVENNKNKTGDQKMETNALDNSSDNLPQDLRSDQSVTTDSSDTAAQTKQGAENKPESYKEAVANFGIVFMDHVPISAKLIPPEEIMRLGHANTMTPSELNTFPITSINRVAWNPNLGSHLLVASGGNSGLIRIHRIHWLQQANVEKLRAKLQLSCGEVSDDNTLSKSSTSEKSTDAESVCDSSETCEMNCVSPVKTSDIEWLKQANIEKIRTGLQAQQQEIECNEKAKMENNEVTSSSQEINSQCQS